MLEMEAGLSNDLSASSSLSLSGASPSLPLRLAGEGAGGKERTRVSELSGAASDAEPSPEAKPGVSELPESQSSMKPVPSPLRCGPSEGSLISNFGGMGGPTSISGDGEATRRGELNGEARSSARLGRRLESDCMLPLRWRESCSGLMGETGGGGV